MTDNLRDRIAALLELLRPVTPTEAADAVIRELGLEPERRVGPGEPGEGLSGFIRYVTGWEADD